MGQITLQGVHKSFGPVNIIKDANLEIKDGAVVLRPAVVIPREDLWAYTPEHLAKVQRARRHAREGRAYRASPADLGDLMAGRVNVEALEERLKATRDS